MAYNVISLIVLTICHAKHALADVKDGTQLSQAMSKAFVPAAQMPQVSDSVLANPSAAVAPENAEAPWGNQLGQNEELKGVYQHLRARMQKLPQADTKDVQADTKYAQNGFGFGMVGLMASVGLVASIGVAAYRKYFTHEQQALQSTVGSQRSRPIVASAPPAEKGTALADLQELAVKLNPAVGYWDPMRLSESEFWDFDNEATIGWLRHSEIKHGRVAMAGFVGYCVHENHIHFPWAVAGGMKDYSAFEGLSAPDVWDALPYAAKLQIVLAIGVFEVYSERSDVLEKEGQKHYMRGGKPGYFPTFQGIPHPVPLKLYDPFNFNAKKSDEWKEEKLLSEINNGRLAMIALISFITEAKIPGSIPLLKPLGILPYAGETMAPFQVGLWEPYSTRASDVLIEGLSYLPPIAS